MNFFSQINGRGLNHLLLVLLILWLVLLSESEAAFNYPTFAAPTTEYPTEVPVPEPTYRPSNRPTSIPSTSEYPTTEYPTKYPVPEPTNRPTAVYAKYISSQRIK